ncbi:hypothetical protein SAMN05443634_101335 [Chishuiella changwenlii]|uniref:Uncharacterized protein n=1 Tax=Chishuiella changwenlii TaxID=1434701 RepID=A0A1M6TAI8_9FLAO|nr:hypothetical protein [Chishuiella changwenlii]GGE95462.1 hypothetical protein GCM10010984_11230 [Chishuiella changwenlii]SHK54003.1 hypothetical protein SAMN05443634_101335 [Chishuiella changwenlii]
MKNLENLNLQELTIQEQVKTEGGEAIFAVWGIGTLLAGLTSAVTNHIGNGLNVGDRFNKDVTVAFGGSFIH